MRVFLVDDEQQAIDTMSYYLKEFFPEVEILGAANDIYAAAREIGKLKPDLVFMDISMPEGSGFELLKRFEGSGPLFVFVSAHSEFAFDAIKVNIFDYLLKPINLSELSRVLIKANSALEHQDDLLTQGGKFQIKTDGKVLLIGREEVRYVSSEGNYSTIHLVNGKEVLLTKNIKKLEDTIFNGAGFFRPHQSFLVNLQKVIEYNSEEITLEGNQKIPISKARVDAFREAIGKV